MIFVVTGLVSQDHRQWPPVLGPGLPAPHRSPQLGGGHVRSPGQQQLGEGHAGAQADDEALCDGRWPPDPPACLIHVLRLSPDPGHAAHLPWAHHHWPLTLPVQGTARIDNLEWSLRRLHTPKVIVNKLHRKYSIQHTPLCNISINVYVYKIRCVVTTGKTLSMAADLLLVDSAVRGCLPSSL